MRDKWSIPQKVLAQYLAHCKNVIIPTRALRITEVWNMLLTLHIMPLLICSSNMLNSVIITQRSKMGKKPEKTRSHLQSLLKSHLQEPNTAFLSMAWLSSTSLSSFCSFPIFTCKFSYHPWTDPCGHFFCFPKMYPFLPGM